ncbi:MAG: PTS sugar transporter subunit IIB [Clostridiales bacterium]|nr:PTS sugar transporter subunit IIB [Clostridiales bacterium]
MTGWSRLYDAQRIIVVDNETAENSFLRQVMEMSVPRGMDVKILNEEEGMKAVLSDSEEMKTIVLTKTPQAMKKLLDAGADMKQLNVGGMGYVAGRKRVLRNIQMSSEELDILNKIAEKGVEVFCQIVPDGKRIELSKVKL